MCLMVSTRASVTPSSLSYPELNALASSVTFKEPKIPIETCSRSGMWSVPTAKLIADHTCTPVYVGDTVERIETDLGQATWIEAGSNSSITDYEDEFWTQPNVPDHTDAYAEDKFDLLDGVYPAPITAYNVPSKLVAMAGWIAPKDARTRIVLHMHWHGQTLPILFRGLPSAKHAGRIKDATW
ncbi:hypothetical protein HBH56_154470 [Parastagonospora nodorum]|uniref:Uncharacterized protein n=1 Tax=Phaeosphaeria nodorum (strain SN15 / ATCC MYA-4574 / FGSC 10173) TaxID=321614 RepID=A0A7U2F045_PHANO|nr:hypothetical protein HBH56_154470 [Parastagonospora nodorum]QRC95932.1 hypothetical protein JI435_055700 [Parastagonospora nodorum SN15]KAH3926517.1 hypothetical protein HBH54_163220 [Parastagonospora nodorum]KAH3970300.1 hypothetical protein HBH52_167650 [Parastagonospora nodorum]KAH3972155.1 hypothetical protein HBH51_105570 [Parastagonospora nodorum]